MRYNFCGWYFRCQSDSHTLAVIPAVHRSGADQSCSIQLITDDASWNVGYPITDFHKGGPVVQIGESRFSPQGIRLELRTAGLHASGALQFGPLTPIGYDIMGPFRWVPGMECRHSVFSMLHFTGAIGVILWRGKQYRLATYLGAKVIRNRHEEIIVRQGSLQLTVRQLEDTPQPLAAPTGGAMIRTIHEHAACRAFYCFQRGGSILFALEAPNAAFEYEFPRE